MSVNPLVSVIVPVYNSELYLSKCLESILYQTYSNLQIICINDGSNDQSGEILNLFQKNDERIEVYTTTNEGASSARNKGLEVSSGEYICFIDSDDWLDKNMIELEVNEALKNDSDLVMANVVNVYSKKTIVNSVYGCKRTFDETNINELRQRFVGLDDGELKRPESIDWLSCLHGKLYRRDVVVEKKLRFDKNLIVGEDTLFNIQYVMSIKKANFIPFLLYYYRKSNKLAITQRYKPDLFDTWKLLFQRIDDSINTDEYEVRLRNRRVLSIIGLSVNEMRADDTFVIICKRLRGFLDSDLYSEVYNHFNISRTPLKWKLFFLSVKNRNTYLFGLMALVLKKIIDCRL